MNETTKQKKWTRTKKAAKTSGAVFMDLIIAMGEVSLNDEVYTIRRGDILRAVRNAQEDELTAEQTVASVVRRGDLVRRNR